MRYEKRHRSPSGNRRLAGITIEEYPKGQSVPTRRARASKPPMEKAPSPDRRFFIAGLRTDCECGGHNRRCDDRDNEMSISSRTVTSADLLHRGWSDVRAARGSGKSTAPSHVETLPGALSPNAGLVTIIDGSPSTLSWLGGVRGMRTSPLGTDRFGQTGDLPDLYRTYRLDAEAIVDAAAELFLGVR